MERNIVGEIMGLYYKALIEAPAKAIVEVIKFIPKEIEREFNEATKDMRENGKGIF